MTFQDIFKSSFLENIATISILDMVIAMVLAFLLGLFIFFIYKKSYSGVMYSASFGVTLIALSLITTLLIMTVVSNIVLSLGMVGALSIVRFRTAIKEPMDIAFLFWAIAVGIVLAAGLIPLAVFGSIFIGQSSLPSPKRKLWIPVYSGGALRKQRNRRADPGFREISGQALNLKSKSVDGGCVELNYEVRLKEDSSAFVNELEAMPGVSRVVLVSYNGDYMG